jgi:hypothetical protein
MTHYEVFQHTFFDVFIDKTSAMANTEYLRRAMYLQQNSVMEEFCERSVGHIFEKDENGSTIEVRFRSNSDYSKYEKNQRLSVQTTAVSASHNPERSNLVDVEAGPGHRNTETDTPQTTGIVSPQAPVIPDHCQCEGLLHQHTPVHINILALDTAVLGSFIQVGTVHEVPFQQELICCRIPMAYYEYCATFPFSKRCRC